MASESFFIEGHLKRPIPATFTRSSGRELGGRTLAVFLATGLDDRMKRCQQRSFVAIGTHDPNYSEAVVQELRGAGARLRAVNGRRHV